MSRPVVSVMVPVHDGERTIAHAVASALEQPYEPLEVVVADDASEDATQAIVRDLQAADPRVRYVRREARLGRVANYRRTLYHDARGDYAMNLDGDDWLLPTTFVRDAVELLEADPRRVLAFGRQRTLMEADGRSYVEPRPFPLATVVPGEAVFFGFADGLRIPHLAALYRRQDACAVGFYRRDALWSDADSMLRLVLGRQVAVLEHVVGVWRIHDHNASHGLGTEPHWFETFELIAALHEAAAAAGLPPARLRAWKARLEADTAYGFVVDRLRAHDLASALRYARQLRARAPDVLRRALLDPRRPLGSLRRRLGAATR